MVVIALVVAHFGAKAIRRGLGRPAGRAADRMESPRAGARATTVVSLLANLFRAFVAVTTFFIVLGIVGINLTPLLASATVIGATIGFGAQALVRDYLSGFLLTLEDQFGIGDTITTSNITGVVEELSLRVTRVRAFDGTVWFVPNGDIREVANASRGWARAVVDIPVSPTAPDHLERIERLLAESAAEVAGPGSPPAPPSHPRSWGWCRPTPPDAPSGWRCAPRPGTTRLWSGPRARPC